MVVLLCFCGGAVVFLWRCGCVYVVVNFFFVHFVFLPLCFCGVAIVFLWWFGFVFVLVFFVVVFFL